MNRSRGFTLLELLITIGILAVLASTAVLIINPVEYLRQSRDTRRVGDLDTISKAIDIFTVQKPSAGELGTSTVVYISIPDTSSTCANLGLQALPAPWQYRCVTSANLRKIDGTGWLPINFSSIPGNAPLTSLPVDPSNAVAGQKYYAFTASGRKYEVFSVMESERYALAGPLDKLSTDNGDDFTRYEVGSNLAIAPWSFEFVAFPTAADNSGLPGWYKNTGSGSVSAQGDSQDPHFLRASGYVWYVWQENIPFDPDSLYKVECRARQITDPTVGGKGIYCGLTGVAENGVTKVNLTGVNSYGSQHYRAFSNTQLTAGNPWTTAAGYTRGYGAPNGTSGACTNPATPCVMHANVRYVRPLLLVNYNGGNGVMDMDYIRITKQ